MLATRMAMKHHTGPAAFQSHTEDLPFIGAYTFGKKRDKTAYLHKPPAISPNLRKPSKNPMPKTYIARVILFENSLHRNILDTEMKEIEWKIRTRKGELYQKRFTFIDDRKRRQRIHELWETGYQRMKNAYIKKYGTKYIPVPSPEPEEVPFFINARLIPPLNVVYFYLDAMSQGGGVIQPEENGQTIKDQKPSTKRRKSQTSVLNHEHGRLVQNTDDMYTHSIEDPRFQKLQHSLIPPDSKNDGYLQLSPGYHPGQEKVKIKKWSLLKQRAITLPRFYSRASEGTEEQTSPPATLSEKDPTFPQLAKSTQTRHVRLMLKDT